MKNSRQVDFVYVIYHSYADLKKSLAGLVEFMSKCQYSGSIHIIDNSFSESSPECIRDIVYFCQQHSTKSRLITYYPQDSNLGFGSACNKAMRFVESDYVVFVNTDTSFELSFGSAFELLLGNFEDPRVAIIGPKVLSSIGACHFSCFSFDPISILLKPIRHWIKVGVRLKIRNVSAHIDNRLRRITYEGLDKTCPSQVDWVSGCFMIVRTHYFKMSGGFDERYFLYFDDVDLCRKMRQLGFLTIYDPRFTIIHEGQHQSSATNGVLRSIVYNTATQHHVVSWVKYCCKWRIDFLHKLILLIKRPFIKSDKSKPYRLDFSVFTPLPAINHDQN